jgi:hypothetical protein
MSTDYAEFTIEIASQSGGGFRRKVLESPTGDTPEGDLELPFPAEVLAGIGPAPARRRPDRSVAPLPMPYEEVGTALYQALLGGRIGELFESARRAIAHGVAERGNRRAVRLRLKIRRDDPARDVLAGVPWELLYAPERRAFLARDPATPVVRDLTVGEWARPLAASPPLDLLVVVASPDDPDLSQVSAEDEIARIRAGLRAGGRGRLKLHALGRASFAEFVSRLRRRPHHVVHFLGHGGFNREGTAQLAFEAAGDGIARVRAAEFADALKTPAFDALKVVVLSSCSSGAVERRDGADLFAATAPWLLLHGVPAVVAAQYKLSIAAAHALAREFYGALGRGETLEEAVTAARAAIMAHDDPAVREEWVTPVLYLHAKDGRVVADEAKPARRQPARRPVVKPPSRRRLRLGIFTAEAWEPRLERDNDRVLSLAKWFSNRFIANPADWDAEVFPAVRDFLRKAERERRPLRLDFAANATVAFAAGWLLGAKSGLDIEVRQRVWNKPAIDMKPDDGPVPERLWQEGSEPLPAPRPHAIGFAAPDRPEPEPEPDDAPRAAIAADVALAVGVTWPVLADVQECLRRNEIAVARVIAATIWPKTGHESVQGGAHALALAQDLAERASPRLPAERGGTLHVFASAPNALLFYLGQLAGGFVPAVLYENPFESGERWDYRRSMTFPPPAGG